MRIRIVSTLLAATLLAFSFAPSAIAADVVDVGLLDQAELAALPAFVAANKQLATFKAQLDGDFSNQMKGAKTDADKQRIQIDFQQRLQDKQREIVGPIFTRAQLATAQVSMAHNLSVVVDKRIVIYGGTDITKDVESLFLSSQAINPSTASPAPSTIGFVDQNVLDSLPKVKAANDQMSQYAATQKQIFAPQMAAAKGDQAKQQQVYAAFQKTVNDKENELLKPLVDATKSATADVAKKKNLILVVDRADVLWGGTDITTDVQSDLSK
ncbi:MAG TPA: OmpH family outer membrane protein [Candidatus Acidoferrales bacterium]|jgi:outer membrane protein|nr:OmpH family outer membrane protein [Candidatus Acidoferrales bacterium]